MFAGFDTSLLSWRIDEVLGLRDPENGVGYVNGFVLATGVRDELDWDNKCHDTRPFENASAMPTRSTGTSPRRCPRRPPRDAPVQ